MRLNHSRLAAAATQTKPFCLFSGKFSKAFFLLPAICWLLAAQGLQAQTTWYVNAAAAPGGNGTSWATAYQNLQQALTAAGSGHKIWVAEGAYSNGPFVMKNGVEILGGFPNTGNPGLGDRDWMAHVTTLSGGTNVIRNNFTVGSPLTGTAVLDGFTVTGGNGDASGGGMLNNYASPTVRNCVFSGNSALQGAGMWNYLSSPTVTNCVFSGNICEGPGLQYGAGMANEYSSPTVTNCLFSNNVAGTSGSGMHNGEDSNPLVLNCTFSGNTSNIESAIYNRYANSNPTIKNCIIWGNDGGIINNGASSTVTYSIVQGGFAGTGNLNVDPLFVSSTDFHLQNNSPARGAATSAGAPATDFDGDARPQSGGYDMGYDEVVPNCPAPGTIWYVNAAVPEGNGTSWDCAFRNLQDAINAASSGHEIRVAEGTYVPTAYPTGCSGCSTNRDKAFHLKNGVKMYGGFPNTGNPGMGDRDPDANPTILSGDFNGDDVGFTNNSENAYHVVLSTEDGNATELDGFTIRGGNANSGETTITVEGHTFGKVSGGGMYNGYNAMTTIRACKFLENRAIEGAGMLNAVNSSPSVSDCIFFNNWAPISGGGMNNFNGASPTVVNCAFWGNEAEFGAAVRNHTNSDASYVNCSFSGNDAGANGGAMRNVGSDVTLKNCILWGNSSEISMTTGTTTVTNSIVEGGYAGTGNLDTDPLFVSQPPAGLGSTGDLHLQVCSPAIDAGTSAGAPATDLDGNGRPFDAAPNVPGNYDMGAYEYQQALPAPTATCQNITVQLDANGSATVTGADVNDGSTGCGALSYEIDGQASRTFNCDDIGVNTVTLTVTDAFNNTDDCSATITVADDDNPCCVPPVVTAPTVTQPTCALPTGTISVNASGGGTLEYSVDNGSNWDLDQTFAGLAPGSYHIKVRLEANQTCETTYASNPVVLVSPFTASTTTDTWTGCVSTDWHTAGNWADGSVPTTAENVIIPNVANDPVISTAAFARQIDIVAGGNLLVEASGSLTISGSPDYGILNIGTVVNEGTIFINGTPGFGINNLTPGSFTNKNLLQIGNLSGVGVGINNDDATFINQGGSITIDRCSGSAIKLNALGFQNAIFTNDGSITIGSLGAIGTEAIIVQKACGGNCQASFSNTSCSALINIVASAANNVIVLSGGATFDNNGGRIIENSSGNSSITTNSGYVQNLNGGTFSIGTNTGVLTTSTGDIWTGCTSTDWHTTTNWLDGSVPTAADDVNIPNVPNDPVISAAAVAKSVHVQTSGALTINAGASLTVNGSFSDAGATQALKNDGTLDNSGILIIGSTTPSGQNGLVNTGVFNNNTGGEMTASRASTRGIFNSGTFTNYAKITLGVGAGSDVGPTGVLNTAGTFSNSGCTALFRVNTNAVITTSGGTFTNSGSIIENATGNSNISTNSGFVQNLNGGSFFIGSGNSSLNAPGVVWTGCTSTDWYTASNWMLGVVPTSSSDVKIAKLANDPIIDAAVLAKTVHVLQGATLTINATKSLTLDGSTPYQGFSQAMQNNGTVNNNGVITIGATTSSGHSGISNYGPFALFNNNAGAEIVIDRATSSGLFNQRTFNNSGKITIGASNSTGLRGLENQQNFNNNAGGEITIDNSTEFGLANFALTFNNSGKITIGAASVSVGINGIRNTSVTNFNNNPGGEIKIDNSTSAGIYNQEGTFTNAAKITIGAVANVGDYGLRNTGTFSNNTGGEIAIDRSTLNGLYNQTGTITNAAEITIGALASVGTNGVQNLSGSTFTNSGCTALLNIVANAVLSNDGTFNNSGRIIENASGNSSITSNSGTVQNLNGGTFSITTNTGGLTTATGDIWTGCLSTDWHTAGNWFDGSVPTAADNAVIPNAINDPVIGAAAVARSVNVEAGGALTVEATGSLPINSAASPLFTNSGTVVNEGTISLNTTASFNFHRLLNLETGTFTNNNVLQLGNSGSQTIRGIYNRGSFVNAPGGSISIAKSNGGIFQDAGSFVNNANIVFSSVNNSADSTAIVLVGGTFSNTPCSATILDQPGSNLSRFSAAVGSTFTNDGLLTENSSGFSSITNNTGIVQNLGGGSFNITNNTGVLTTNPGPQTACCPPANIFYVNAAATGANNGSSWADAFTDLQNALNSPCTGITQIWVAEGTYKPTSGTDRSISFSMKNGVEILGGFPNTGDPGLGDRDWVANVTTLSGEIGAAGMADNSNNIIVNNDVNSTAVLDGFQVSFGSGMSGGTTFGGGMLNLFNASPTVRNCTFSSNHATSGAGVYNFQNCFPTFTNCAFIGNQAVNFGAFHSNTSVATLTNCSFSGNLGESVVFGDFAQILKNCIIWGNGAPSIAGLATITHSIVQQPSGIYPGTGNLNLDPLFVSTPPVGLGTAGDLHLQICSPAIDAANDADAPANDLDGNARFDALAGGSIADMGAYEFQDEATPTVANCQTSVDAVLDNNGSATVLATALNDGSTGCSPLVFSIGGQPSVSFDCSQIGNQSVTLTATYVNRTSTCATTVHVLDNTPPTITCPDNIVKNTDAGQCSAVTTYSVTASDNCAYTLTRTSPAGTASGSAFPIGTTNVEWSVTDTGGNATSCAFTVTVADEQLPGITCPGPVTVTCAGQVPAVNLAAVTASDNCGVPTKSHVGDATSNQTCTNRKTITRTYRATDGSGNSTTCAQVITVYDNVKPNFTSVPANVTVQCNSIPAVGTATATDGCGGTVTVAYNGQTSAPGACPDASTITRQWTATDACGNTKTATQRITVIDSQKPNFISVPANITVQCSAIPAPATPMATDNCDATVAITYNGQTQTNGACPNAYTLTRTWTAADNCGNTKTITQRITVVDNGKPVFTAFPANTSISCHETPPAVGNPTASDGCGSATVTYLGQTTTSGNCPGNYQIKRTWRATDACGNSTAATQSIQVSDSGAPVFTSTPGPLTIECGDPLPPLVNPTASDACGGYVHTTFLGNVPSGSGCAADYTITRTWRAEDLCGNSATTSQVITVLGNNNYGGDDPAGVSAHTSDRTRMTRMRHGLARNNQSDENSVEIRVPSVASVSHPAAFALQPNPTTDRIWLDLTDFAGEAVTVSIFSDLGQLIWENWIPVVEDLKLSLSLREAGAKAGIYTVSVRSASGVAAKRVVLME